jgi:hypothetical protein
MRLLKVLLPLFGLVVFAENASAAECLKGLRPALVAGGFSGSVDCHRDQLSVRYVGQVIKFSRTFEIYSYRYRLKPVCPECAIHGGQRIVFMERGRYIGQYASDFVQVAIRSGNLILQRTDFPDPKPVEVRFTAKGPPKKLWDGGDVLAFFR